MIEPQRVFSLRSRALALGAGAGLALLTVTGTAACRLSLPGVPGNTSIEVESGVRNVRLDTQAVTAVYRWSDRNTATIFVSDIPVDSLLRLADGAPPEGISGQLIQINMFLLPRAGRTPIDFDATNTTISVAVIAPGAVGIYGGGGFMLPAGRPGEGGFGGAIRRATLAPIGATPGFKDALGVATLSGSVRPTEAPDIAARLADLMAGLTTRCTQTQTPAAP